MLDVLHSDPAGIFACKDRTEEIRFPVRFIPVSLTERQPRSIIKLQSDRGISHMAPVLFFMICAFAHSFWQFLPDIRYPIRHRQKQPKKHILFLTSFCQDKCRLAAAKQEEHETEYHIL